MMRFGASSAKVPPWSGRAISTRVTRRLAAPIESCEPTCPPTAASSFEPGHASPGAGMPAAGEPRAKGSPATNTRPRNG